MSSMVCETWKVTKRITRSIRTLINRYLRVICKMSLLSVISNEEFIEAWTKEARGSANQSVEMEVD